MTNNEMLNSMSVEEKAKFFTNMSCCDLCSQNKLKCDFQCVNNISKWLEGETERMSENVKCCNDCMYFYQHSEENYTTFCCKLYDNHSGFYSDVLSDIGWNNYDTAISAHCPLNKGDIE